MIGKWGENHDWFGFLLGYCQTTQIIDCLVIQSSRGAMENHGKSSTKRGASVARLDYSRVWGTFRDPLTKRRHFPAHDVASPIPYHIRSDHIIFFPCFVGSCVRFHQDSSNVIYSYHRPSNRTFCPFSVFSPDHVKTIVFRAWLSTLSACNNGEWPFEKTFLGERDCSCLKRKMLPTDDSLAANV